jgi:luciferase family oxidoreductase group 1
MTGTPGGVGTGVSTSAAAPAPLRLPVTGGAGPDTVPLSVLDLSTVGAGHTSTDALEGSTLLVQAAEAAGYHRYWVAEHHNAAAVASTVPAVLIAHLAARTSTIRVGSGGVMLPNHAAASIAEQFAMLEALHPGRIDLGLGRAPGTDGRTAALLRRGGQAVDDFTEELATLLGLLGDERMGDGAPEWFSATSSATSYPEVWLLGSSGYSARLAAALGLGFAHAAHFSMAGDESLEVYRRGFRASRRVTEPQAIVTASVMVADTEEEARFQAEPMKRSFLGLRLTGALDPLMTPEDAAATPLTAREQAATAQLPSGVQHVGTPEQVLEALQALAARTGATEVVVTTAAHDPEVRARSLELLAGATRRAAAARPAQALPVGA